MPRASARPRPGGALAAALYYTERHPRVSLEEAGERHGVSRQAVSKALRSLGRPDGTPGRRARADAETTPIRITVDGQQRSVRLTAAEVAAFTAAAGALPLRTWLGLVSEMTPRGRGEPVSSWVRRSASAASKDQPASAVT